MIADPRERAKVLRDRACEWALALSYIYQAEFTLRRVDGPKAMEARALLLEARDKVEQSVLKLARRRDRAELEAQGG